MAILFSGDFHASAVGELYYITKKNLRKKYGFDLYNRIKYHVILGDGSFMWPNSQKTDEYNYTALARRPFPILCVIGNHEPILGMSDIPETDIGIGETVYQIKDNPFVAYLRRGKVYNIDGIKCLVLGGALSIDKDKRKPGKTWWELEYWTEKEKQDLFSLLKTENSFDCVLTHTGPNRINTLLFQNSEYNPKFKDEVALMNDQVDAQIQCREWWCGHWHRDKYFYDTASNRRYQYLYNMTKILDRVGNEIVVYDENGKNTRQLE